MKQLQEYQKPTIEIVEIKYSGLICTSPNANVAFYLGGGGVYDEGAIVDNGDY